VRERPAISQCFAPESPAPTSSSPTPLLPSAPMSVGVGFHEKPASGAIAEQLEQSPHNPRLFNLPLETIGPRAGSPMPRQKRLLHGRIAL